MALPLYIVVVSCRRALPQERNQQLHVWYLYVGIVVHIENLDEKARVDKGAYKASIWGCTLEQFYGKYLLIHKTCRVLLLSSKM